MAVVAVAKARGFKTFVAKPGEVQAKWYLVDADGLVLGRMASAVAMRLMGKHKPTYTRHLDTGDFVVVVNAEKIQIDPRKRLAKVYRRWSGYLGGLKKRRFEEVQAKKPEWLIREAVRKMLPKNLLAKDMLRKLKVYRGPEHEHQAQRPEKIELF